MFPSVFTFVWISFVQLKNHKTSSNVSISSHRNKEAFWIKKETLVKRRGGGLTGSLCRDVVMVWFVASENIVKA